jgi:hypothetical protein
VSGTGIEIGSSGGLRGGRGRGRGGLLGEQGVGAASGNDYDDGGCDGGGRDDDGGGVSAGGCDGGCDDGNDGSGCGCQLKL